MSARKKVNAAAIADELREGSVFFAEARRTADAPAPPPETTEEELPMPVPAPAAIASPAPPVPGPADESVGQSVNPSTSQSTGQSFDTSVILGRPKAFYITERQDRDLDTAVDKLAERLRARTGQKIDRSTLMRLLLEQSDLTADETADRLAGLYVRRLVSQLTG